ncbi:MAG TPA: glycosyltransferase family 2 protein [Pirellulales bacterium]|nr:glycosyltransferase family 2 protein [Pirellulales bacterium]
MASEVDVVVLTPNEAPLRPEVLAGVARQAGIKTNLHRMTAAPRPDDVNRWATIARGRNRARRIGAAPWLMFLDDDVVLGENCLATLVEQLRRRPVFGALAADYLGESHGGERMGHVAMGATLFRRVAVCSIRFRWESGKCECQCCCDDLRDLGMGIAYEPRARAEHLTGSERRSHRDLEPRDNASGSLAAAPRILAAFDRRHLRLFRRRFLASLRSAGNSEHVTAVGYGLYPSELRALSQEPHTDVFAMSPSEVSPARRRVKDFQTVLEHLPAATPVAYWDAGDVVFQDSLQSLWEMVRANPDKLLVVREPQPFTVNTVANAWTLSIRDSTARRETLELFRQSPVLNAGFAAGSAGAMLRYLRFAAPAWHSPALVGSTDWGDQTGFNLYCHRHPDCWHEIEEGWNYCLAGRGRREAYWDKNGRIASERGTPIAVAHGNAKTLSSLPLREPRF